MPSWQDGQGKSDFRPGIRVEPAIQTLDGAFFMERAESPMTLCVPRTEGRSVWPVEQCQGH